MGPLAEVAAEKAVGMLQAVAVAVFPLPAGRCVRPLPVVGDVTLAPLLQIADPLPRRLVHPQLLTLFFVLLRRLLAFFFLACVVLLLSVQLVHAQHAPERRLQRHRVPLYVTHDTRNA